MTADNQRIRILIADDSRKALISVCKYLEFEGDFEIVATANNGLQLLRKVEFFRPDLVLTDLSIPRINGLQAATVLRKTFPELRIIIFSELNGLSLREECLRRGADSFVEKNKMPEKLMEEVRRLFPDNPSPQ
jgi:DNA-binding NarL/FixJ family response regulator